MDPDDATTRATARPARPARRRPPWRRRFALLGRRVSRLPPTPKALLWAAGAGFVFTFLNTLMRALTLQLDPFQTQFLRYLFGFVVLLPLIVRHGPAAYRPQQIGGQFIRGAAHTAGLLLWFAALPKIPIADTTAIGFTTPIFIMIGAWLFFREPMRWDRWVASLIGFAGVVTVVAPGLSGGGGRDHLLMLASAPVFAASFLLTKALTRYERTTVILLWQSITVTLFSLPLALTVWQWPNAWQWAGFVVCGALGSTGHYALTRSFATADISSTQSLKFLELVWAALLGLVVFSTVPSASTLAGGAVICIATVWIARRESRVRVVVARNGGAVG